MKHVELYTDGACRGNPGRGGWAAILVYGKHKKELTGGERVTTNNRMELSAALYGLKALQEPCAVTLYSDSRYLVDAIRLGWLDAWRAHGWRRGKEALKNPDLWQQLDEQLSRHTVTPVWVKGHDGHAYNERCDALACAAADVFAEGEVEKFYLNFSDPWPKARHAKRRLTSVEFLERYEKVLLQGGTVEFKTDNTALFNFSLEQIKEAEWTVQAFTYDLHHNEEMNKGNIMTEYEEKFSQRGNPINKLIAVRR